MADRKNVLCSRSSDAHANAKLKIGLEAVVSPPSFVFVGIDWCSLSLSPQIRAFWRHRFANLQRSFMNGSFTQCLSSGVLLQNLLANP